MFEKLKNRRSDPEFEEWFLKYNPGDKSAKKKGKPKSVDKNMSRSYDNKSKTKKIKTTRKTFGEYLF